MNRWMLAGLWLLIANPAWAASIEGVVIPDSVMMDGQNLVMNGAGVRTKFFFDIYVGALYLPAKTKDARQIIYSKLSKRISINFLRGGIGHAMLAAGWTSAFENELSANAMAGLKVRLQKFNAMFGDIDAGDQYAFNFLRNGSTIVTLNGKRKGSIGGVDFQRALLGVWLGKNPDDSDLKQAMLNGSA